MVDARATKICGTFLFLSGVLGLPYDADTNKTIEQIDMIWLKNKRSIVRV